MNVTTTITIVDLHAQYAVPIADATGLDADEYEPTADGLATLLRDAAEGLGPMDQTRDWLEDAAADLQAIDRLGDDGPKTQELLQGVRSALYDIRAELA